MKQMLVVTVANKSGVLNRVTGVFSKRQININSMTVTETANVRWTKMTFVLELTAEIQVAHIINQLNRLIDVIQVIDMTHQPKLIKEVLLIKISGDLEIRNEVSSLLEPFQATLTDTKDKSFIVQSFNDYEKNKAILELLEPYSIQEISKSGIATCTTGTNDQVTDLISSI